MTTRRSSHTVYAVRVDLPRSVKIKGVLQTGPVYVRRDNLFNHKWSIEEHPVAGSKHKHTAEQTAKLFFAQSGFARQHGIKRATIVRCSIEVVESELSHVYPPNQNIVETLATLADDVMSDE